MTDPSTPAPSDEAVSDAWCELHDGLPSGCSQVLARKALTAAYAIDAPRIAAEAAAEARARCDEWDLAYANLELRVARAAAEARADYDDFIEGLTAKLNAAGVPAMPSWPDAIDWLIERAQSAQATGAARLREALEQAREALHRACLERGSTDGYRVDFDAIGEALAAVPEAPEAFPYEEGDAIVIGPVYEWRVCMGDRIEVGAPLCWIEPVPNTVEQRAKITRTALEDYHAVWLERRRTVGPWERVEEGTER